jgi:hypothetical protein
MLHHPDRDALDLHLPIAGILRVLLCDAEVPILLRFAKAQGKVLRIWAPRPAREPMDPDLLFYFKAFVCSWEPYPEGYEMSIEEFLVTPIGVASLPTPDGRGTAGSYSAKQVIKWTANKEGVSHLDFDKPATLENLKASTYQRGETITTAIEIRRVIYAVGEWTLNAVEHLAQRAA